MALVSVCYGSRSVMLRETSLTVDNISMIFKLNRHSGVYMLSEEEKEIILPNNDGTFIVLDTSRKYIVNGDPLESSTVQTSAQQLGTPLSYQLSNVQRGRLNPPPAGHLSLSLQRPKFTRTTSNKGWKKSMILVEISENGTTTEKFQIHVKLDEDSSTVDAVTDQLQDQLGYEVSIMDSKFLPIVSCEMTKGIHINMSMCTFIPGQKLTALVIH